jgi:hypothetical protein
MINVQRGTGVENRTELRKPYSGSIFFATNDGVYEGRLNNYSRHGLFIATRVFLPVGELLTIALPYLDGNAAKSRGQILWRNINGFGVELFRKRDNTNLRIII